MRVARLVTAIALSVGSIVVSALPASAATSYTVYAVTSNGDYLSTFPTANPSNATPPVLMTGKPVTEHVVSLAIRPANNVLYALTRDGSSNGRVYSVNPTTAVMSPVPISDAGGAPLATFPLTGVSTDTFVGANVDGCTDSLRVATNSGQNYRLRFSDFRLFSDTALSYASGDPNVAASPRVSGLAHSKPVISDGTCITSLFAADYGTNTLDLQSPSNSGVLTTIGALGVDPTNLEGADTDFDDVSYLAAQVVTGGDVSGATGFFTLNRATGAATQVGWIGGDIIRSIAISRDAQGGPAANLPEFPLALIAPLSGLALAGVIMFRRRRTA